MRDLIVLGAIFGALPLIFFRPYVGILFWAWISYMNPHRLAWSAYDYPVAAVVAGTTLFGLLLSKEPKRMPWSPVTITMLLFIGWMSLTTVFALMPDNAMPEWTRAMKIQLMTLVTLVLMQSRERVNLLVAVIVASVGFYGVKGGIFTLATAGHYKVFGPPESFIADNNTLALALIMIIPLIVYLQSLVPSRVLRLGMFGAIALCLMSVVASYSRGAFLATAVMLLVLFLRSRHKMIWLVIALVSLPVVMSVVPQQWFDRISTIRTYEQDASAMGRINAWWYGYNLAADRPIVGGGFGAYHPDLFPRYAPDPDDFHDAHSIYFEVLAEHGFIGLGLFILLGLLAYRSGGWIMRQTKERADLKWARDLASMVRISLIGYAAGGAFLGLAYFDLYYHLVALLVLVRVVVERNLKENVAVDVVPEPPQAAVAASGESPARQ